ncbi:MAG: hypothetical protein Q7K43_00160 [Candidatus Woesearchaeota archaeon]|nr:hypothetical protein [Candidatus Woesearchaeota archaeon]
MNKTYSSLASGIIYLSALVTGAGCATPSMQVKPIEKPAQTYTLTQRLDRKLLFQKYFNDEPLTDIEKEEMKTVYSRAQKGLETARQHLALEKTLGQR